MQDEDFEDNEIPDDHPGEWPRGADLVHPGHWLQWVWDFCENWIFSREIPRLMTGLPFLVALIGCGLFGWWLRESPDDSMMQDLETRLREAVSAQDVKRQETCLLAMVRLRPWEPEYQYRLGRFLLEHDRAEGLDHIRASVESDSGGYLPARLWLVEQAVSDSPEIPMDDVQIEQQLQKVLRSAPDHPEAHRLLADHFLRKKEWKLAEDHLTRAAQTRPEFSVMVAKLKQTLNRDPADVNRYLKAGADELLHLLSLDRSNAQVRIALAEARFLLGDRQEARELLTSGLEAGGEVALVRRALSDFDLNLAAQTLSQSVLNRDACLRMMLGTQAVDAGNPALITNLVRVQSAGARITPDDVRPAVEFWKTRVEANPQLLEPRLLLSQLLAMSQSKAEAAEVLQPVLEGHPELRLPLAQLLLQSGQTEKGSELIEKVAVEQREVCAQAPDDPVALAALTETLLTGLRAQEVLQLLEEFQKRTGREIASIPQLTAAFGRACVMVYDSRISKTGDPAAGLSEAEGQALMELLSQAVICQNVTAATVDRLARLSFSQHPVASQAESVLNRIRASGDLSSTIPLLMGTYAIQAKEYSRAIQFLDQANNQARGRDVGVLNNLAVALVRAEPPQAERALELANVAITLMPNHPDILSTRGEVLVALQRWQEAMADLVQALPARRDSKVVHSLLLRVYTELQNPTMAEEHRKTLQRLESGS